jgi:Uma2 family endonuclease
VADVDTELRHVDRANHWVFLPDVSVTVQSRLHDVDPSINPVEVLPDVAIEVLSPEDRPGAITRKIARYMQAGVPLLWVVDPEARQLTAWRPGASPQTFGADDTVSAAPILPGFSLRVGDICTDE